MKEQDKPEKEIVVEKKVFQEPTPGTHSAECVEVFDFGLCEYNGTKRRRGGLDWKIEDECDVETGKPLIKREFFTLTMGKGARLVEILEELGIDPGKRFVLNQLKGTRANLVIALRKNHEGEWETKITTHLPLETTGSSTKVQTAPTDGNSSGTKAADPIVVERSKKEAEDDTQMTDKDIPF
jgi:hypothetical protein